jgi:PAS domain S-box-containing protein
MFLAFHEAFALTPTKAITQYMHDAWTAKDGAPSSTINAITQTPDGYLWLGTAAEGLIRFDGVSFVRASEVDALFPMKANEVRSLLTSRDGALWVGALYGLARLDKGRWTLVDEGRSRSVDSLWEGSDGTIWFAREKVGLGSVTDGRVTLTQVEEEGNRHILVEDDGTIWLGADRGLLRIRDSTIELLTAKEGLADSYVTSLWPDSRGGLWVGTRGGLCRVEDGGARLLASWNGLEGKDVTTIYKDRSGNLWVGTSSGGVHVLRKRRFESFGQSAGLTDGHVTALYEDREGSLWLGTSSGLNRFREGAFTPHGDSEGLAHNNVASVLEGRDGSLWAWSDGGGLNQIQDGRIRVFTTEHGFASEFGGPLFESRDGSLWVGHDRGLSRFVNGRATGFQEGELGWRYVALITEDDHSLIVYVMGLGYRRFENGRLRPYLLPNGSALSTDMPFMAHHSRDGTLWLATVRGAVAVRDGELRVVWKPQRSPVATSIYEDAAGTIWLGTWHGIVWITQGRVSTCGVSNGLFHNRIYRILEDRHGYLWMSCPRGIFRVSKEALRDFAAGRSAQVRCEVFGMVDGLRTEEATGKASPAGCVRRDGTLWFTTTRGLVSVDPDDLKRNEVVPPVVIEKAVADGQVLRAQESLALAAGTERIEFHYNGLSLLVPERVRFRFKLDGYDNNWVDAGSRRVAHYTRLPPGAYTFGVRAANNDGLWNEEGASLRVSIAPRWHERTVVRLGIAVCLILVAFTVFLWRESQSRRRENELERRVDERTTALHRLNLELEERVSSRTSELAAEKERLAVTLRSIADAVMATDIEGRVVLMNRVAEELTGWSASEAAGRPLKELLPLFDRESREPLPDPTESVLIGGRVLSLPLQAVLVRRDGREILIADSVAPIRDQESRIVGAVLVFRDVTERRRIDEQLQSAEKLEALGILAGGIAHDFNNLLTGVFGYIDLALRRDEDRAKRREILNKALAVLNRARGLTGQLLTFSRSEQPATTPLALGELIKKSVEFALSGANVSCEVSIPDDLWHCRGDERQIDQVVDNLLLNARQAMPAGGRIELTAANVVVPDEAAIPVADGRYVRICVRDRGPGIPSDLRGRIFEPFFTTKSGGTGLGLATSYSIVRKHGGHIEVESEVGRGSVFCVYLPASSKPARLQNGTSGEAARGVGRILVLDDEDYVRDVAREILEGLGYTVECAASGEEALRIYGAAHASPTPFDLVILDLTVPGDMGGVAVLNRMRETNPHVMAIASSGYSADRVMTDPITHGFAGRLTKPYTTEEMGAVVARVLVGIHRRPS